MSVLHFDRFNELFCLHYPVNVLSVLCFKVSVRLSVHRAASASVELLISNFRPLCRRPLLSPSPPSSHKRLFKNQKLDMMKYLSLYFLSPPIATLFPQTTPQLIVLVCLDFKKSKIDIMKYLSLYFV